MPEVGPHHVPHALHAGDVRRARRHGARRSVRAGAPHADPRLGRGARRGVRECRHLAARPLLPARRRGHARAVARECRAVRNAVGMFDATTLGKIEVVGPDAAEFLDRLYTGSFARLAPGRCRYGVMLNEAGFVMDDGVVARLAPDRFHVTTTTGGAARVLHHMEDYLQTEFPELRVWLTSITEQWAVIAVQGPLAREVIAPLVAGHRHRTRGDAAYERARRPRLRRSRAAVPCQLHRRTWLRDQRAGGLRRVPSGRRCTPPASRTASRPTAPRRCMCCAPRRATSSSARRPTAR